LPCQEVGAYTTRTMGPADHELFLNLIEVVFVVKERLSGI